MKKVSDYPAVQAASERLQQERMALGQDREELRTMQTELERSRKIVLRKEAEHLIGDATAKDVGTVAAQYSELSKRVDDKGREIETRELACQLLEGKLHNAEASARGQLEAELQAEHAKAAQQLTDAMHAADEALQALRRIDASRSTNDIPFFGIRLGDRITHRVTIEDHNRVSIDAPKFFQLAKSAGFQPSSK